MICTTPESQKGWDQTLAGNRATKWQRGENTGFPGSRRGFLCALPWKAVSPSPALSSAQEKSISLLGLAHHKAYPDPHPHVTPLPWTSESRNFLYLWLDSWTWNIYIFVSTSTIPIIVLTSKMTQISTLNARTLVWLVTLSHQVGSSMDSGIRQAWI